VEDDLKRMLKKVQTFPLVTLGHIRGHGCRNLLVYCTAMNCSHGATMSADRWPDDTPIRPLGRRMVCSRCGTWAQMFARIGGRTSTSLALSNEDVAISRFELCENDRKRLVIQERL
jgi:hypothetical protein